MTETTTSSRSSAVGSVRVGVVTPPPSALVVELAGLDKALREVIAQMVQMVASGQGTPILP